MRMDNKIFSEKLRDLRKSKGMSQEQLSEKLGISVQAVSKWECAQSYPDIELLPIIADIMGVSIDYLLRGGEPVNNNIDLPVNKFSGDNAGMNSRIGKEVGFPDDNVLRIVQFKGRTLLKQDNYDPQIKIPLYIEADCFQNVDTVEIWGSAEIKGDIGGNVSAGGGVNCGDVGNNVECGGGVHCGNVSNNVECGGGVNCGDVGNNIDCGGGVNCGNVGNNVDCGGGVKCGDVGYSVDCGGDVKCASVGGDVSAGKNVVCENVEGDVSAGGSIECKDVTGDVSVGNNVKLVCADIDGDVHMETGELHCKKIHGDVKCSGNIYYDK